MSGGAFDYYQYHIERVADDIEQEIRANEKHYKDDYYSNDTIERFKQAVRFLRIAAIYTQRIDWLLSGDDSEDSFHERLADELDEFERESVNNS